jgi:hypothetical protein
MTECNEEPDVMLDYLTDMIDCGKPELVIMTMVEVISRRTVALNNIELNNFDTDIRRMVEDRLNYYRRLKGILEAAIDGIHNMPQEMFIEETK